MSFAAAARTTTSATPCPQPQRRATCSGGKAAGRGRTASSPRSCTPTVAPCGSPPLPGTDRWRSSASGGGVGEEADPGVAVRGATGTGPTAVCGVPSVVTGDPQSRAGDDHIVGASALAAGRVDGDGAVEGAEPHHPGGDDGGARGVVVALQRVA